MKTKNSEKLKAKFYKGETSADEESWLKSNLQEDDYFIFLQHEQQTSLDLDFDEFVTRAEEKAKSPIWRKKKTTWRFYAAASVIGLMILITLMVAEQRKTSSSSILNNPVVIERSYSVPEENSIQHVPAPAKIDKQILRVNREAGVKKKQRRTTPTVSEKSLDALPVEEQTALVYINGKAVYDEAEAEVIALQSLHFLAANLKTGIVEMKVLQNLSVNFRNKSTSLE